MKIWRNRTAPHPPAVTPSPTAPAAEAPDDGRCTGTTARGTRCKLEATAGRRCPFHPLELRQDAR